MICPQHFDSNFNHTAGTPTPDPHPRYGCETGNILSGSDSGSEKDIPASTETPATHEMLQRLRFQVKCSTGTDDGSAPLDMAIGQ